MKLPIAAAVLLANAGSATDPVQKGNVHMKPNAAPRMLQFRADPTSLRRGYNAIDVSLAGDADQRVIWI